MKAIMAIGKEEIEKMRTAKEQLEKALRLELDQARQGGDLTKAAEIQYGRIPELEKAARIRTGAPGRAAQDGVFLKKK